MALKRYLFWCANEHVDFRVPEFETIADIFDIDLHWVEKTAPNGEEREPWVIIDLPNDETAQKILSRSISTKLCVELWSDSTKREDLHRKCKAYISDNGSELERWFDVNSSFKVHAVAFMKKYTQSEKLKVIETFDYLPCKGKVNLKKPDVTYASIEYYGFDHNNLPENPFRLFFGRLVGEGQRDLISKFSLKNRLFIGNTSMDPQLSFLMANLAGNLIY